MFEDHEQPKPTAPPPNPTGGGLPFVAFDKPKSAAKSVPDGVSIHVMPKDYYGVAPKTMVKKVAPPAPKPLPPKPPPKPVPLTPAVPGAVKPKRAIPVILIIGVLLLLVIGVGGFLFLRSLEKPAPPAAVTPLPPPLPPVPEPTPLPEPTPPAPEPIRPGIDTDSDGLTDVEERSIYGSDPRNPDTDGDSFIDGNEVLHLYDPTETHNARLINNAATAEYILDETVGFLLPRAWMSILWAPSDDHVEVSLSNGEAVAILLTDFTEKVQTMDDVVKSTPQLESMLFQPFTSKQGYSGLRDATRRIVVLELSETIGWAAFIYDPGSSRTTEYLRTFEMIINSLGSND